MTTPLKGSHATYDVGPGKTYLEPDTVPWGALTAGDVVNIYQRSTPYAWKLCVRGQGTQAAPIVINGVTDASGNRPKFDFNGATTASGCNPGGGNDVFDTTSQWSLEDYGGIVIRGGVADPYQYKPAFIQIKNLELAGAAAGNSFINLNGQTTPYNTEPAAIWVQIAADILVENNVIDDNAYGVFTMSKDNSLGSASERITVRSNRIYGNGIVGSYLVHNLYIQTTNPVIEGNYFGVLRAGAAGSTYKSRSSGEIFRYNYVESSARAIDWVYAEDQTPGIATQPDYGTDYAYGNIIVNSCSLGNCASHPIHYGGDNEGEQGTSAAPLVTTTPYRSHLYFYNNTVVSDVTAAQEWRTTVFDPSLIGTTIDAWNNVFYFHGDSNFAWVQTSGQLNLRGNNLVFGAAPTDATDQALAQNFKVSVLGSLVNGDPAFAAAATFDFHIGSSSAAIDMGTGIPAGISPGSSYIEVPVSMQLLGKSNGLAPRTQKGVAIDLGAFEN